MVYRHWYTTLNEMMRELSKTEDGRQKARLLKFARLPGGVSMSGEWYLAIPAHSAAPDAGLDLIKLITSRDAELNRVRLGVGLPTRRSFYERAPADGPRRVDVSPYFVLDAQVVKEMVERAFHRSDFSCYHQVSQMLAYYLKKVIEIEPPDSSAQTYEQELEGPKRIVREVLDSFVRELDYAQASSLPSERSNPSCQRCRHIGELRRSGSRHHAPEI
jgi:hypothetical protein